MSIEEIEVKKKGTNILFCSEEDRVLFGPLAVID